MRVTQLNVYIFQMQIEGCVVSSLPVESNFLFEVNIFLLNLNWKS